MFWGPDRSLEIADVDLDVPKGGEVRVQISAAGVCRSDLHVREGDWNRRAPVVMGHEGAGTVVELGPGVHGQGLELIACFSRSATRHTVGDGGPSARWRRPV